MFSSFGKNRKKKQEKYVTMELHTYQVRVFSNEGNLLYNGDYDGFSAVEAIKECRKVFKKAAEHSTQQMPLYPLRFTTLIK